MKLKFKILLLLLVGLAGVLSSCSNEDDLTSIAMQIEGNWSGVSSYNNPVSGTKFVYLDVNFSSSSMGSLTYDGPTSYSTASFSYNIENNVIYCHGYKSSTSDTFLEDFSITFRLDGDRLYPSSPYNRFILTKDGSIETDSQGNEIKDDGSLLEGVWMEEDGYSLMTLENETYTEYVLLKPFGKVYSKKITGSYYYDFREKKLFFDSGVMFEVLLNGPKLVLKNSNTQITYNAWSSDSIPTDGENANDEYTMKTLLENSTFGWIDSNGKHRFNFFNNGEVSYVERGGKYGSYGSIDLSARGTYNLSGKDLKCYFEDVYWSFGNSDTKDLFPGWDCGKSIVKNYTVVKLSSEELILVDSDGHKFSLTPSY